MLALIKSAIDHEHTSLVGSLVGLVSIFGALAAMELQPLSSGAKRLTEAARLGWLATG